ncbi:hypothetical protein [Haloplasma contractile]|nr:hypothetical protein [Haloplasma contractile]
MKLDPPGGHKYDEIELIFNDVSIFSKVLENFGEQDFIFMKLQ